MVQPTTNHSKLLFNPLTSDVVTAIAGPTMQGTHGITGAIRNHNVFLVI